MKMKELFRQHHIVLTKEGKKPMADMMAKCKDHWVELIGDMDVEAVQPHLVQGFRTLLLEKGLMPDSVSLYLRGLSSLFTWAWRWDLIEAKTFDNLKKSRCLRPYPRKPRIEFFTPDELSKIEKVAKGKMRVVFFVAILTGLRKRNIETLRWKQIDFQRGIITVTQKGGGFHQVPISDKLRSVLMAWKNSPESNYSSVGLVFPSKLGNPIDVDDYWKRLLDEADVDYKRFHALRHTFATGFLSATGDLMTLSKLLGHSTITTTQIYAHVTDKHKDKFINVYSQALEHLMKESEEAV